MSSRDCRVRLGRRPAPRRFRRRSGRRLSFVHHRCRERVLRPSRYLTIRFMVATEETSVGDALREIVGKDAVLDRPNELMMYEYDGGLQRSTPQAVVFPT